MGEGVGKGHRGPDPFFQEDSHIKYGTFASSSSTYLCTDLVFYKVLTNDEDIHTAGTWCPRSRWSRASSSSPCARSSWILIQIFSNPRICAEGKFLDLFYSQNFENWFNTTAETNTQAA